MVLDDELAEAVERLVEEKGYQNRSEAIRDLSRRGLRRAAEDVDARGDAANATQFAEHVIAERGARHGRLLVMPADLKSESHSHDGEDRRHLHVQVRKER